MAEVLSNLVLEADNVRITIRFDSCLFVVSDETVLLDACVVLEARAVNAIFLISGNGLVRFDTAIAPYFVNVSETSRARKPL